MLTNQQVAAVFANIADAMELLGEDRFKYQAYRRVSETLSDLPTSLQDYYARKALKQITGVGPAIATKIAELLETGKLEFYERLREQVPDGVIDVMRVPGVGPKTARRLYQELGITSLESLEAAAKGQQIRGLKGLGAKLEVRILAGLQRQEIASDTMLLGDAIPLARLLIDSLRVAAPSIVDFQYAGSVRRGAPTVDDIDLVAAADDPTDVLDRFVALPQIATVERHDAERVDAQLHNGKRCSLFVTAPAHWGAALALWTGSEAHRARLRTLAEERGLRLDERGLWRDGEQIPTPSEASFYEALGLPWIEPELREDWGEIEAAQVGRLPQLVRMEDMRADLHTHTHWSDGGMTVTEAAETALRRGYRFYAITDHGFYMGMVNGLDAERLRAQRAEIDATNAALVAQGVDLQLLQGIEVDILPNGSLALLDEVLATLDWVVASPHVNLRQDRVTATQRLLSAIRNPHVDCIGHPTGRLLLRRDGLDVDMDVILQAAAESGVVLEVDGSYSRLDLDAQYVKRALELGIKIAIDSDAHHANEIDGIEYGVITARRGWATAADVVNTWTWNEIEAYKAQRNT